MRRLLFVGLALCGLLSIAQDAEQPTAQDSIPVELAKKIFVYNAAKQFNDPTMMKVALYDLLAENPNNFPLRDSLALLYLQQQQFASAALVAQEVATVVPDDMFATEIAATSLERLGVKNRALGFYEKLWLNDSKNLSYIYKIGFLQNDLKLYEEAMNSATMLEGIKEADETMLVFPTADQKGQEVSMKLGAIRLKGMIEESKGDKAKAKEYYNQVLAAAPDFEIIKQQIADLDK